MIINGREIANDIKERLKKEVVARDNPPTLFIFSVGDNAASEKFLAIKKRVASDIGVPIVEKKFNTIHTDELSQEVSSVSKQANCGIIVQLPLPQDIEKQIVLNAIPPTHDPDVLSDKSFELYKSGELPILPPVVGAIKEILFRHNVFVGNKSVVIVGKGKLVGVPAAVWFERHQSIVQILDSKTPDPERYTRNSEIIVLGAGSPHFLKPDMIKEGVVILDAGTSESGGRTEGDADVSCARKASLFTPTPGGIGPVTVAILFRNLLELTK